MLRSGLLFVIDVCLVTGIRCCEKWAGRCADISTNSCKVAPKMYERSQDRKIDCLVKEHSNPTSVTKPEAGERVGAMR